MIINFALEIISFGLTNIIIIYYYGRGHPNKTNNNLSMAIEELMFMAVTQKFKVCYL